MTHHPAPIVSSLLENDLYKFTMWQALLHSNPGAQAEYRFVCRNPGDAVFPLSALLPEVNAALDHLCTLRFTEDELAVFKRGRNASKASVAKHASPEEYRASTGFECLLGWLYLNGQLGRVHELFETLWQQFDPNEK